jgi:hypothetical protein
MKLFLVLLAIATVAARPQFTSPKEAAPEYGHGLTATEAGTGWVCLFDGTTKFGWSDGAVERDRLVRGTTTSAFGRYELRIDAGSGGDLLVGKEQTPIHIPDGQSTRTVEGVGPGPIRLRPGVVIRKLTVRPLKLRTLLDARSNEQAGWKVLPHPSLPADRQAKWERTDAGLHVLGGPGCVQLPGNYGDFVLQATVRTLKPLTNAGVFFRCKENEFLNGYEAQVFNGCYDQDPAKPARYATGAIDDRQNARRLVSRDSEPFVMTVVASGPHLATWVNGVQVTDWTDERPKDDNARQGLRLKPGPIQLQAHERTTDVVFENIRIAPLD